MGNFKEELKLMIDKNTIIQVASYESLDKELTTLLDDDNQRTLLQNNTNEFTHNAEAVLDNYTNLILGKK